MTNRVSVSPLSALRRREFARLDRTKSVYLDHTGAALYPTSLLQAHHAHLSAAILGNPHANNPASALSTRHLNAARAATLAFFRASPRQYAVVFTANATAAVKLVGEAFPWRGGGCLALLVDNHNSVLGLREFARVGGACVKYVPIHPSRMTVSGGDVDHVLRDSCRAADAPSLFAYPAQSNFSGVRHPLSLIARAHALGEKGKGRGRGGRGRGRNEEGGGWYVLLDAAAYVPTARLDLSRWGADFVAVSFYKMFGLPTGVGALIVRREALGMLRRPWFAGGTVGWVGVGVGVHVLKGGVEAFEDGTVNFLEVAAVQRGLNFLSGVGMRAIGRHVAGLTERLLRGMLALRYGDGGRGRVVRVYGPVGGRRRGGTVAFDVIGARGGRVAASVVMKAAGRRGISIRAGCFCNPGAAEVALGRDYEREVACLVKMGRGGGGWMRRGWESVWGRGLGV